LILFLVLRLILEIKIKGSGKECPLYMGLRDVPLALRSWLRDAFSQLQVKRARAHHAIFHHNGESLHAAFTKPEVFNPARGRSAFREDPLDFKYPAVVQVVKASQTCRIRALGEHGEAS